VGTTFGKKVLITTNCGGCPVQIISQFFLIAPQLILAPVEYLILVMYAEKSAKHFRPKMRQIKKFIPDSSRNVPVQTPSQAWR
jgi:hypothetical protein